MMQLVQTFSMLLGGGLSEVGLGDTVPDIPRLYTALAEWAAVMVYVLTLKRRYKGVKMVLFSILAFVFLGAVQVLANFLPLILWIPGMIVATGAMYLCILWLCKLNKKSAIYWTARAFVLAEFAASLEWQLFFYLVVNFSALRSVLFDCLFLIFIYAGVYIGMYCLERRYSKSNRAMVIAGKDLIASIAIAVFTFAVSNISFISSDTPFSGRNSAEIFYIRTLVDFCGVILFLAQQEQRLWLHAKLELDAMQNIFSRQYEQYRMSKENIELLNRRYHDLKHQIQVIKSEENPVKKAEYLEEMETAIKMFEAQNKTGNKVLDTILTSKSLHCVQNDINFTCVADGTLLHFLDVMDICSIFGNALDNAIESVSKLNNPEKRLITMAVYAQNKFLMIRVENYFEYQVKFENGLPMTTKNKKENHGYGIKSIKHAAEKYGGNIKINLKDNWFSLGLLIPLPDVNTDESLEQAST